MSLFNKMKNLINKYKETSSDENFEKVDGNVPILKSVPIGLQHLFAMFIGNLTPLLIVLGFVELDYASKQQLIQNGIFIASLASLIQLLPIWKIGSKLPLLSGMGFSFIGVSVLIVTEYSYGSLIGAVIIGGIFTFLLAFTAKYWLKFFPPIVSGCFIFGLGLSLIKTGVISFAGGESLMNELSPKYEFGSWQILLISSICLISTIVLDLVLKGFWKNLSILFSLLIGYLLSLCFKGMVDFSNFNNLTVFSLPKFTDFSSLKFELSTIIPVVIMYLVVVTEAIGATTIVTEDAYQRKPDIKEVEGTISGVGLVSFISGTLGCLPVVPFTSSAGIVIQTKARNRIPLIIGMVCLLIISLMPPLAALIQTIPEHVLGSCTLMIFISIAVSGMQLIAKQGFNKRNTIILSLSLALGYGISLVPELLVRIFNSTNNIGYLLFSNSVSSMFIFAFLLNLILPKSLENK